MFSKKDNVTLVTTCARRYSRYLKKIRDYYLPLIGDAKLTSLFVETLICTEAIVKHLESRMNG